ncbi:hypothetical protein [Aureispira sp. CCB-QB1]|uniref:hypothetical protein n=1 Tax=Aureispira sp. CCB-QB1 TaxID=1313421 RepID=UPI0006969D4B|nr:hypothetical protein [Aureispira sp. CCB-QB1]
MAKPFILVTFGEMDAGKTYNLEIIVNGTARTKIVYNYGQKKDWEGYEPIELVEDKGKLYFLHKKSRFLFETAFMKKFKGKKVKIATCFDRKPLDLFYVQVAKMDSSVQYAFLVIDDATAVFENSLTRVEKTFISRCKHSDIKIALASHDPHYFPRQLWGLVTHVRLFRTTNPPPLSKKDIIPCFDALLEAWEVLQDAPKYSYYTLDVKQKELTYTPYKQL